MVTMIEFAKIQKKSKLQNVSIFFCTFAELNTPIMSLLQPSIRKTLIAALLLCLAPMSFSQTRVSGRVVDAESTSPVPFATVAVYSAKDTSLVDGAISSDNGRFIVSKVPQGEYVLRASFVGYITFYQDIEITDESKAFEMGDIALQKGIELDEFELVATAVPVLFRGDTMEYSADAFRPIEGSMLEELLKRLPGVDIDRDGKITVNGKTVSQILVEGEIFFTDDPQIAAKNIPADFVQKVQAFEKKSDEAMFTGIDDGREQTVLNLILKPEIKMGWFGRLRVGGGFDASNHFRYANSININSFRGSDQLTILGNFNNSGPLSGERDWAEDGAGGWIQMGGGHQGMTKLLSPMVNLVKKFDTRWSIRGSYRYDHNDHELIQSTYRENILPHGSQFFNQESTRQSLMQRHNLNAEVKYTPNERNELTIQPMLSFTDGSGNTRSIYDLRDDTLALVNHGNRRGSSENSSYSTQLRLSYGHRFAKPRRTFRTNLNGSLGHNNSTSYSYALTHFPERPTDTLDQRVLNTGNRYSWEAGATYTEPLVRDFVLSLSYRISSNENTNERSQYAYDSETQGYDRFDSVFSNDYRNYFFSQDMMVQVQKTAEKYTYSVGFSLIPSLSLSRIEGMPDVSQRVLNLAPQADLRYSFSQRSRLHFGYRGETRQPTVSQLQPVPSNSDPLNIFLGNPELKPEFTHQINASYNTSFENKSHIYVYLFAQGTQNQITRILIYDPYLFPHIAFDSLAFIPGARINMWDNVDFVHRTQGYLSYGTPLFLEKIRLGVNIDGSFNSSKSVIDRDINVLNELVLGESVDITYSTEKFRASLNGRMSTTNTRYSLQSHRNNRHHNGSFRADFDWHIIKNKVTLSSNIGHIQQRGLSADHNPTYTLWNAQLSWNIGKTNDAQFIFQIVDILNDRQDTRRWSTENSIQDITERNTLRRLFMVSFIYNRRQTAE